MKIVQNGCINDLFDCCRTLIETDEIDDVGNSWRKWLRWCVVIGGDRIDVMNGSIGERAERMMQIGKKRR